MKKVWEVWDGGPRTEWGAAEAKRRKKKRKTARAARKKNR